MNILKKWLPFAFLATLFAGLVYVTVQQSYRQSANDPQIAMAEDAAATLAAGTPLTVVPSGTVDIAKSLSPYIVVYDESGKPVAGNGMLNSALPNLPAGIFDYTRTAHEDRVTWQPNPAVRAAIVLVHVGNTDGGKGTGGFVMAGRSLREVEVRVDELNAYVGAAWLFALIGTFVLVAFFK